MCEAAGAVCQVTTNRAPRGPKRGYLKAMQARIGKSSLPTLPYDSRCPANPLDDSAAALEGAMLQQHSGGEHIDPTCDENWADGLFTADQDQHVLPWDFEVADVETLLQGSGLVTKISCPPPQSSAESTFGGAETAGSPSPSQGFDSNPDELASPDPDPRTRALEGPNGMYTTNISSLMQAELYVCRFDTDAKT